MLSLFMTILGMIPGVSSMITGIVGKFYDAKVQLTAARIGGDVSVANTLVNAAAVAEHERVNALQVFAQSRVMQLILIGFAAPLIIWFNKVIVWDICLGWGSTEPIRGQAADWGNTIVLCLFGSSTIMNLGHMYFNRDKRGE